MTLEMSSCLPNGRWVGDLKAAVGRRINPQAVLRCGELDAATEQGIVRLTRLEPGVIVDLRSRREITAPHPLGNHVRYRHRPFIDERRDHERDRTVEQCRSDLYRGSLRRNQRTVAAAVQAILEAPSGPVVVHCRSGVDRTGMLIAVILDSVGVSRSLIAEDYATFTSAPGLPAGDPPTAPTMTQTLAELDRDHGGSVAYLRGCGLAADVGTRLAERLTT